MKALIVLFNLQPNVTIEDYEKWAHDTDLATVRNHPSVESFDLYKTEELFRTGNKAPYQYVEVIRIKDMAQFDKDLQSEAQAKVSAEFSTIAQDAVAMLCDDIG